MKRLVLKTKQKDFYSYAKRNLETLIRGYLPENGWKPIPNRKNDYELMDNYDCLEYYRCASISKRVKKIPFFVFWLNLKKQDSLTYHEIKNLLYKNGLFLITPDTWEIIHRLKEDQSLNSEIQKRLEKAYNSNVYDTRGFNRISFRYQEREIFDDMILNMLKKEGPFSKIESEILEFIDRHGTTTWREMRRLKRSIQNIRPYVLKWFLNKLEEEKKISIHRYPPRRIIFLQSLKNH